jgi:hypothetical protein
MRPADVWPTDMTWEPTPESLAVAQARVDEGEINPPEHCSACHR